MSQHTSAPHHQDHDPGTELIDPVCGMRVTPQSPHHTQHADRTIYFCSAHCLHKFRSDPAQYSSASAVQVPADASTQPPAPAPAGATYTCPMHPEILQDHPGSCPQCGMALEPLMPSLDDDNPELDDFTRRFWWTLPLTLIVMVLAMFGHQLAWFSMGTQTWIELVLSLPVVLWAGKPFFVRGLQSLTNRSPNMWTLISFGTGAAFVYSVIATLAPGVFPDAFMSMGRVAVYFEAAVVIVSLTLFGQMLELRARSQTSSAIRALLGLAPT